MSDASETFSDDGRDDTHSNAPRDSERPSAEVLAYISRQYRVLMARQNYLCMLNQLMLRIRQGQAMSDEDGAHFEKLLAGQEVESLAQFLDEMEQQPPMPLQRLGRGDGPALNVPTEQHMKGLPSFAYRTIQELRSIGMPEHLVQIIETYRPGLQLLYQRHGYHGLALTMQQAQIALVRPAKFRREAQEAFRHVQPVEIPFEQTVAYGLLLENVYRMTLDVEPKLPVLFTLVKNDDHLGYVQWLVKIVSAIEIQRNRCSQSSPRFILGFKYLRAFETELVRHNVAFSLAMEKTAAARGQRAQQHFPQQQGDREKVESNSDPEIALLSEALGGLSLP
ncbi:hypothetical protein FA13DRAFT_1795115 [Coprinellus micaceus]|uniref:Uncharacterized protein n=1 Tax=Coprinellus micaceus TaxID=71717 RepID=A0A4Y7SYZ1_COPMI|nr:hypothetical protein FA13DRAFT_1795115 [Coprinellus micaceus]